MVGEHGLLGADDVPPPGAEEVEPPGVLDGAQVSDGPELGAEELDSEVSDALDDGALDDGELDDAVLDGAEDVEDELVSDVPDDGVLDGADDVEDELVSDVPDDGVLDGGVLDDGVLDDGEDVESVDELVSDGIDPVGAADVDSAEDDWLPPPPLELGAEEPDDWSAATAAWCDDVPAKAG